MDGGCGQRNVSNGLRSKQAFMWDWYKPVHKVRSSSASWVWSPEELWTDPVVTRGLDPGCEMVEKVIPPFGGCVCSRFYFLLSSRHNSKAASKLVS